MAATDTTKQKQPPVDPTAVVVAALAAGRATVASLGPAAASAAADAALGRATAVLGAKAVAELTEELVSSMMRFTRGQAGDAQAAVRQSLQRQYPERTADELDALLREEMSREKVFQAKMADRLRRDLPTALSLEDPEKRRAKLQAILDREARYVALREEAIHDRAQARAEMIAVKEASPLGAFWTLSPHVRNHTPDCVALAGKFWPWQVIEAVGPPPRHHGCACSLLTLDEAVERDLMDREQANVDVGDALHRAQAALRDAALLEAQLAPDEWEAWVDELHEAAMSKGAMIAFYPSRTTQRLLAGLDFAEEPAGEIHLTLVFLGGDAQAIDGSRKAIRRAVARAAAKAKPLHGVVGGLGMFSGDPTGDTQPLVANADVPGLNEFRADLVRQLGRLMPKENHGFTPHITLRYVPRKEDAPALKPPKTLPLDFDEVFLVWGGEREAFPLGKETALQESRLISEESRATRPQKCKRCSKPATKSLVWAEGAAYVPVCDGHEDAVRKELGPHSVDAVLQINEALSPLRYAAGFEHGGEFMPRHGGNPGRRLLDKAKRALASRLAPELPPNGRELARRRRGRTVGIEGRPVFVPEHRGFDRTIGGRRYTSPPFSTRLYRDGLPFDGGGPGQRNGALAVAERKPAAGEAAKVSRRGTRRRDGAEAQVLHALVARDPFQPPVSVGRDAAEALAALHGHGFLETDSRRDADGKETWLVAPDRASELRLLVGPDGKVLESEWQPKDPAPADRLLGGPPRTWGEFTNDLGNLARDIAARNGGHALVRDVKTDASSDEFADHAAEHRWNGDLVLGHDFSPSILEAAATRARGGQLTPGQRRDVWASYQSGAHEALHAAAPFGRQHAVVDGLTQINEALVEELSHAEAARWLTRQGQDDVLQWRADNPTDSRSLGTYVAERAALDRVLNAAGIAPEEREDFMRSLLFDVRPEDWHETLGHLIEERQGNVEGGGKLVAKAESIARAAHEGQRDADGPHIDHVAAVASRVHGDLQKATAWLHDTVEDSKGKVTPDTLRKDGVNGDVVDAVTLLSRKDGEDYQAYLRRIRGAPGISGQLARAVKHADAGHNAERSAASGEPGREAHYRAAQATVRPNMDTASWAARQFQMTDTRSFAPILTPDAEPTRGAREPFRLGSTTVRLGDHVGYTRRALNPQTADSWVTSARHGQVVGLHELDGGRWAMDVAHADGVEYAVLPGQVSRHETTDGTPTGTAREARSFGAAADSVEVGNGVVREGGTVRYGPDGTTARVVRIVRGENPHDQSRPGWLIEAVTLDGPKPGTRTLLTHDRVQGKIAPAGKAAGRPGGGEGAGTLTQPSDLAPTLEDRALLGRHFRLPQGTFVLPASRLVPSKLEPPDRVRLARQHMEDAAGGGGKRAPLAVHPTADGRFVVVNGSATLQAGKERGLDRFPVLLNAVTEVDRIGKTRPGLEGDRAAGFKEGLARARDILAAGGSPADVAREALARPGSHDADADTREGGFQMGMRSAHHAAEGSAQAGDLAAYGQRHPKFGGWGYGKKPDPSGEGKADWEDAQLDKWLKGPAHEPRKRQPITDDAGLVTTTGPAGGSNGAQFAEDADGRRWLVKTYRGDEDRVATELLANAIYRKLGIDVPAAGTLTFGGKPALAYPLVEGVPGGYKSGLRIQAPSRELARGFMADAFLANWDVVGLEHDNVLWPEGTTKESLGPDTPAVRLDQGGSLQYRAMGSRKPFGPVPTEVWTMASPRGGQAFGTMALSPEAKRAGAKQIGKLTDSAIDGLVDAAPFKDGKMRDEVRAALKARRDWMRLYADGKIDEPRPAEGAAARAQLAAGQKGLELRPEQEAALEAWGRGWDELVNAHHRQGGTKEAATKELRFLTRELDSLTRLRRTKGDATVWASLSARVEPEAGWGSLAGKVLEEPGFLGLSTERGPAERQGGALVRVLLPDGSDALYLHGIEGLEPGAFPAQPELVMPRRTRLKVLGAREERGRWVLDVVPVRR